MQLDYTSLLYTPKDQPPRAPDSDSELRDAIRQTVLTYDDLRLIQRRDELDAKAKDNLQGLDDNELTEVVAIYDKLRRKDLAGPPKENTAKKRARANDDLSDL